MEALRVEGLCRQFGGVSALRNVTFSVESGEKVAVIGPNGAARYFSTGRISPIYLRITVSSWVNRAPFKSPRCSPALRCWRIAW